MIEILTLLFNPQSSNCNQRCYSRRVNYGRKTKCSCQARLRQVTWLNFLSGCVLSSYISWLAMLFLDSVKLGMSDWIWFQRPQVYVFWVCVCVCIGSVDRDEVLPVVWIYTAAGCFLRYVQWSSMRKINSTTCVSAKGSNQTQHNTPTRTHTQTTNFQKWLLSKMWEHFRIQYNEYIYHGAIVIFHIID